MAHITGGGFYENIPRMFTKGAGFSAVIHKGSWTIPPIFFIIEAAASGGANMFNTFNMGIGFVLALAPENVRQAIEHLDDMGFPAWEIGHVEKGTEGLRFA
jgi:phosphoribosylformylglycinamidine cyclo-ligase